MRILIKRARPRVTVHGTGERRTETHNSQVLTRTSHNAAAFLLCLAQPLRVDPWAHGLGDRVEDGANAAEALLDCSAEGRGVGLDIWMDRRFERTASTRL